MRYRITREASATFRATTYVEADTEAGAIEKAESMSTKELDNLDWECASLEAADSDITRIEAKP